METEKLLKYGFIAYELQKPPEGEEVLAFNPAWISEDFNPRGLRLGFQNDDYFISARWCNTHDTYHDDVDSKPIVWKPISVDYSNETFESISRRAISYMNKSHHPHSVLIVNSINAQVYEGVKSSGELFDYLND